VSPRKNTAWVPAPEVARGLNRLRELSRRPEVVYIDGLFPPVFAAKLRELGLKVRREITLMIDTPDGDGPTWAPPANMHLQTVGDLSALETWLGVWHDATYAAATSSLEAADVESRSWDVSDGHLTGLVLYRDEEPVGVVRLSVYGESGHINALAVTDADSTAIRVLVGAARAAAVERGCQLVFITGHSEQVRHLYREIGFVDSGSIVCYAEAVHE
jgi:hypothetical protein